MKRALVIALAIVMLFSNISYGQVVGFNGGIKDDYLYKEVVFVTGRPIVVEGEVEIDIDEDKDMINTRYRYELSNPEEDVRVERRVSYVTNLYKKEEKNQTVATTSVDSFSEKITVGDDRYNLGDYQLSRSIVYDNRPAVKFYSGNLTGKKTYYINGRDSRRNEGTVTIETNGDTIVGYDHYWGASETYILTQDINSKRNVVYTDVYGEQKEEVIEWDGLVTLKLSSTDTKDFSYIRNEPTNISFRGGLLQTEKQENILQYEYDMPEFDDDGFPDNYDRNRDEENIRMDTVPVHKRLVIPNLKDIRGHWAEENIFNLYSLEVFDNPSPYFGPKLPMTRAEFAKAIVRAIAVLQEEEDAERRRRRNRNEVEEKKIFEDVEKEDDKYKYVKFVKEKGIMKGVSEHFFAPNGVLTRAQAVTILIRALGLESLAPNPPYRTHFIDDEEIPLWAKDAIYVANEIGLIKGDPYGRVNPNEPMSKAEAATFIYRFIKHMKDEITVDYRERILNNH